MIGRNMIIVNSIICSVMWFDVEFYMVRLLCGLSDDGMMNGNIEKLVVRIMLMIIRFV